MRNQDYQKKKLVKQLEIKQKYKQEDFLECHWGVLLLPHPLTNFEIQKCYQNESKFNGVYSRNNLSKLNDTHLLSPNEYKKNDKMPLRYFQ